MASEDSGTFLNIFYKHFLFYKNRRELNVFKFNLKFFIHFFNYHICFIWFKKVQAKSDFLSEMVLLLSPVCMLWALHSVFFINCITESQLFSCSPCLDVLKGKTVCIVTNLN